MGKYVVYLQHQLFTLTMGNYINSIYTSDLNSQKVNFILRYIKIYNAISSYPKTAIFSYVDVTETPVTKQ